MKTAALHILWLLCLCNSAWAIEYQYDFNSNCLSAYQQLMALKNEQAFATLKTETNRNPQNLIPYYLEDYADCLTLLFNGDKDKLATLKAKADERLELVEKGDKTSPWHRFCAANMQLHWALVHLRFGDQFKAAIKFRKSFLLLQENQELFPDFAENQVLLGLENAIAGSIPDNYKWLASILGIKGNVNKGVAQLSAYLQARPNADGKMHEEAMIYFAYLKFYLQNNQEAAWQYINGAHFAEDNNLMRCFIKANLALNYRKAAQAQAILSKAATIAQYPQYPILLYERAEAMLALQNDQCIAQYQLFLQRYRGQHFVKDAYLKMAWIAYLQGHNSNAHHYLTQLLSAGTAATDADKQAQRFAQKPLWPAKKLLTLRILIDAGYYTKALATIQQIDKESLQGTANILEYNFRYGRIFEELGYPDKALQFYNATITLGRQSSLYFAARAALHTGFIYERTGRIADALSAYRLCLSMRHHDAQTSIDQLAKAAINRLAAQ